MLRKLQTTVPLMQRPYFLLKSLRHEKERQSN